MDFLVRESMEVKDFLQERYKNLDLISWTLNHPGKAARMLITGMEPVVTFMQKFLLTSIMSTDWMLTRVANERRYEYLLANRECLPYQVSQADVEDLTEGRRVRLDALVVAFGGRVHDAKASDPHTVCSLK